MRLTNVWVILMKEPGMITIEPRFSQEKRSKMRRICLKPVLEVLMSRNIWMVVSIATFRILRKGFIPPTGTFLRRSKPKKWKRIIKGSSNMSFMLFPVLETLRLILLRSMTFISNGIIFQLIRISAGPINTEMMKRADTCAV